MTTVMFGNIKIHKRKNYLLCDIFFYSIEVERVRKLESRIQETVEPVHNPAPPTTNPPTEPEEQNAPGPSHVVDSKTRERMRILEEDDEEEKRDGPSKKPKKSPIINLIRDNHMKYNKFITKKMPKILSQLGVDSDSDSSD